jgi:pyroglutamyl-peptidase
MPARQRPSRILLTGFEPFGPHSENPSEVIVRRLASAPPDGVRLTSLVLPVAWSRAFPPLRQALLRGRFDAALLLGLAAARDHLEFERFALNWRASPSPDEDGVADDGSPIDPAGPAACFATIPLDALVAACRAAGAPVRTSNHAGTFLCNQVLYQTLRLCDRRDLRCRAGFLHLPPFRAADAAGAAGPPGVPEEVQFRAVAAALRALAAGASPAAARGASSGGAKSRGRKRSPRVQSPGRPSPRGRRGAAGRARRRSP